MWVARTFREKKLPCDALIYLGTDFTPSGWNTHNGEFTWHPTNFPNPKKTVEELHANHFKVVLHTVLEGQRLTGAVTDRCTAAPLPSGRTPDNRWPADRQASCYWPVHKQLYDAGIDGWWPDQGDVSMDLHVSRVIACIGKARNNYAQMSVHLRCIETDTPACSVTQRSSGRAMFTQPGTR